MAANGYVTVCQAVPKADPWSVGRLNGMNLPQNVFMARGRGQSQRGKKVSVETLWVVMTTH